MPLVNELDPDHDLDRLNQILDNGFVTPELKSAYNQLQTAKHLTRGAVFGALLAVANNMDFHDAAGMAAVFAVIDVAQYAIRAVSEMSRRGY